MWQYMISTGECTVLSLPCLLLSYTRKEKDHWCSAIVYFVILITGVDMSELCVM